MLCKISLILSITVFAASLANKWIWTGELLASFSIQHVFTTLILLAVFTLTYQFNWTIVCAFFLITQVAYLHLASTQSDVIPPTKTTENIKILQFNVWLRNQKSDEIVKYLSNNHETFDLIVLQEVVPELKAKLLTLKKLYPYNTSDNSNKKHGITMLSKIPIASSSSHPLGSSRRHYLVANFKTKAGTSFAVFGIHTTSPKKRYRWQRRNNEMEFLAKVARDFPRENKILIGDFNTTPYSYHFKKLLSKSGLKQPPPHFRVNTWPSFFPFSMLRIPIDHVLTSQNINITHRQTGPNLNSDHLPVITHLEICKR